MVWAEHPGRRPRCNSNKIVACEQTSQLHSASFLSFLLLGIGIDDMFVIVQSHINLEQNDPTWKKRPIDELVGETLKHAGVAITITSITDLLVFIVGASTVSFLILIFPLI